MSGVNNPSGGELAAHIADTTAAHAGTSLSASATDVLLGRASSGAGAVEEIACTAAGRAILDDADAAAQRATLGAAPALTKEYRAYVVSAGALTTHLRIATQLPNTDGIYRIHMRFSDEAAPQYRECVISFRVVSGAISGSVYGEQIGPTAIVPSGNDVWVQISGGLINIYTTGWNTSGVTHGWFTIQTSATIADTALTGWTFTGGASPGGSTVIFGLDLPLVDLIMRTIYTCGAANFTGTVTAPKLTNASGDLTIEAVNSSGSDIDLKTQALSRIKINYDGTLSFHATTLADLQSQIGASGWTTVTKTTDETINTDTTVTADSALLFAVAANTKYRFRVLAFFSTGATPGFKFSILGPSTPTLFKARNQFGNDSTGLNNSAVTTSYYSGVAVVGAGGGGGFALVEAVLHNGANAGNIEFGWAQNTSDAGSTTVLAGSFIEYKVVA